MKTRCCNAYSTYVDDALCCKVCWEEVPVGEGDGGGVVVIDICPMPTGFLPGDEATRASAKEA
jgi:hypothetical protein